MAGTVRDTLLVLCNLKKGGKRRDQRITYRRAGLLLLDRDIVGCVDNFFFFLHCLSVRLQCCADLPAPLDARLDKREKLRL